MSVSRYISNAGPADSGRDSPVMGGLIPKCVILGFVQDETSKPNPPEQEPSDGDGKAVIYGMIAGMIAGTGLGFIMNNIALGFSYRHRSWDRARGKRQRNKRLQIIPGNN